MFKNFQEVLVKASIKKNIQVWIDNNHKKHVFSHLFNKGIKFDDTYLTDEGTYYCIDKENRICLVSPSNQSKNKVLFYPNYKN